MSDIEYKGRAAGYWAERLGVVEEEAVMLIRRGNDVERMALQAEGLLSED